MKQTTEVAILPFKVLELAEIISEKKRLSFEDALFYLYNSDLYHDLINKSDRSHVVLWAKELIYDIVFLRPLGLRLLIQHKLHTLLMQR